MTEIKLIDIILPLKDEKYYDNDNKNDNKKEEIKKIVPRAAATATRTGSK